MISVEAALEIVLKHVPPTQTIRLPVKDALGYVLALDLIATMDAPAFDQ